jgi:hypothetical protein
MRSSSKLTVGVALVATLMVVDSALAYYSPRLGRFISRDPIGEPGHETMRSMGTAGLTGLHGPRRFPASPGGAARGHFGSFLARDMPGTGGSNRYAFALDDPVSLYDPLGEACGGATHDAVARCGDNFQTCQAACAIEYPWSYEYWGLFGGYAKCEESCRDEWSRCLKLKTPAVTPLPSNSPECDKYKCDDKYANTEARCFCKCAGDSQWSQYVRGCLRALYEAGVCPHEAHMACYQLGDTESGDSRPWGTLASCFAKCFDYTPWN